MARARNGAGNTYVRDPATALRDAEMVTLHAQGWTETRIAAHYGVHKSTVSRAISRVLTEVKTAAAEELRKVSGERLRLNLERAFDELAKDHPIIRDGQRHDDLTDATAVVALLREIRQTDESIRRLYGLDAPSKSEVRVTDDITAEIAELADQLARADRRVTDRSEEGTPGPAPRAT